LCGHFHASLVSVCRGRFPRFTRRETGYEAAMGLLWVLVLLLIIFALVGGFAVSNWLFVILIIALILLLVGYV
jgi:hypothetical protein